MYFTSSILSRREVIEENTKIIFRYNDLGWFEISSDQRFEVFPIGFIRIEEQKDEIFAKGVIEILEEYSDGIKGLDGFSHIIIIAYLHKVRDFERKTLTVKPRRFAKFGISLELMPTVGVFCTDSPHRPNPIALTIAKLLRVDGNRLHVDDVDLFDGTPVLDIKPYTEFRIFKDIKYPKWYSDLLEQMKSKIGRTLEP